MRFTKCGRKYHGHKLLKARAAMAGHVDSWCQTYADTTDIQTPQHSDI